MARFAGSRSLDERRRRRLAASDGALTSSHDESARLTERMEIRIRQFPLRKIVSHRAWKLWLVGILILLPVAALIYGMVARVTGTLNWYPELQGWAQADSQVVRVLSAVAFLIAAQFAWLIWWMRSQSLNDFHGRYREWVRAALILAIAALGLMTDAHRIVSQIVCARMDWSIPRRETLCWLLPFLVPTIIVFRGIFRDMRGYRVSQMFVGVAAVCLFGSGAFELASHRIAWEPQLHPVMVTSGVLVASWAMFFGLMLHSRHVLHFSAEPPAEKSSQTKAEQEVDSLPTTNPKPTAESTSNQSKEEEPTGSKPQPKKPRRAARKKTAAKSTVAKSADDEKPTPTDKEKPTEQKEAAADAPAPTKTAAKQTQPKPQSDPRKPAASELPMTDEPVTLDKDALKGLSKRERRKLRKQAREEQRRSQSVSP